VLADQAERAAKDQQALLEHKDSDLRSMEEHIRLLEEQVSSLKRVSDTDRDELSKLRETVAELDREKDELQIAVDEKTEQEASRMDAVTARVSAVVHYSVACRVFITVFLVKLFVITVYALPVFRKVSFLYSYWNVFMLINVSIYVVCEDF